MTKNKILVTGAAGFLGSHLAEKLANMGDTVIGVDNMQGGYPDNVPKNIKFHKIDCCDLRKMNEGMKGVDIVYHGAATAHEGYLFFHHLNRKIITLHLSVFSAAISKKVKRIILVIYGRYGSQKCPFTEDMKPSPVDLTLF